MPKYIVYFSCTASTSITVEADDEEAAEEKAYKDGPFPTICAQCAGWGGKANMDLSDVWEVDDVDLVTDG
jgi:hypothetical protein